MDEEINFPEELPDFPEGFTVDALHFCIEDGHPYCHLMRGDKMVGCLESNSVGAVLHQAAQLQKKFPKARRRFKKSFRFAMLDAVLVVENATKMDLFSTKTLTRLNRAVGNFLCRN